MLKCLCLDGHRFSEIASELDTLAQQITHTVHQRADWYQAYADAIGLQNRARILHVYNSVSTQTIGFFPFQLDLYRGTRFWSMRKLVPLAQGPSDFVNLLIEPQRTVEFAESIACWLQKNNRLWEQLQLSYIPESSAGWQELCEALKRKGFFVSISRERCFYKIDTTQNWDEYYSSYLHKKLADMRNRRNRLKKDGIETQIVTVTQGIERYLPHLFETYHKRRQELNQNYATSSPVMRQFLTKAIQQYERSENVLLSLLQTTSGVPMAYQLDWLCDGVRYHYKPAFDRQFEQYSPSKILLFETIKECFEHPDIREFNFMRGESSYKTQFTDQSEGYISLSVVNPWSLRHRGTVLASHLVRLRERFWRGKRTRE